MEGNATKNSPVAHSAELEALRGIAVLKVMLAHVGGYWYGLMHAPLVIPYLGFDLAELSRLSVGGVFLFFFLSGYLLTWTETRRAKMGRYSLRSYAARRALRILPAYYVALAVVLLVWPSQGFWDVLTHLTFSHTLFPETTNSMDPVTWSLAAEVAFYLLLPFVVLFSPRWWQRVLLLLGLVVLSQSLQPLLIQGSTDPERLVYANHFPTTHLYLFIAGMLLRMLVEKVGPTPILATTLTLPAVVYLLGYPFFGIEVANLVRIPGWLLVDLAMAAFFFSSVAGSRIMRPALQWRPLRFCGTISYSMFLLHQSILVYAAPWAAPYVKELAGVSPWLAFFALAAGLLLLAIPVSYLSYRYVESPFLKRKPK